MRFVGFVLGALVVTAFLVTGLPVIAGPSEEIAHLLDFIAASQCSFIRNGVEAAAHVKDKYEYYQRDIHSAEDFIAQAASRNAVIGWPYLVRCGADTISADDWLAHELAVFRQQH